MAQEGKHFDSRSRQLTTQLYAAGFTRVVETQAALYYLIDGTLGQV